MSVHSGHAFELFLKFFIISINYILYLLISFKCRLFLGDLGGNPNKKNSHNETVVHCACATDRALTYVQKQRRFDCLQLLLLWTGSTLRDGNVEKAALAVKDEVFSIALSKAFLQFTANFKQFLYCDTRNCQFPFFDLVRVRF